MKDFTVGVHLNGPTANDSLENIRQAEAAGVQVAWMTSGGVAPDPLAVFAAAAMQTSSIRFGTCVMPTFPRHPLAMAQGAIAVDSLAPGRLRLGVGPSHQVMVEGSLGIPFERPLQHLREYLTILQSLFVEGKVDFAGGRLTAKAQLPAPRPVEVLSSALRVNGFRVAGELSDGAISWVCPISYLRESALPAIRAGAERAGRTPPPLIAHVPLVVSEDREAVYAAARTQLSNYPRIPYYSQMLQDAGFPEAGRGELSDRMIDGLVVWGSAGQVADRVRALPGEGIGELLAAPLMPPGDDGAKARTYALLGELSREN